MHTIFVVLSVVLVVVATPPYIIDVLKGKTKPERTTWLILSGLGIVAFISQLQLGATFTLAFSGLDTLGSLIIFGLSIIYGVGGVTKQDVAALIIASVGIIISLVAKAPLIALSGIMLADFSALVATLLKTYQDPTSETTISWLLFATAAVFSLLTVQKWQFGIIVYPAYIVIANYAVPLVQLISPHRRITS